ncbi:polyketide cyclase [Gordonia sp. SID5947]|uniref:SRPBCC family protein n=1 Tax=Gordonia sp. SID5947 TaxID=2690315 RepID=UPI00136B766A|nr:polyketide cyclase [Gordonia sp. SID5947]
MVDVTRTFTVARPLDEVVTYLRDFANAVDWDPGTQSCEQIGADPVGPGTKWHNVTRLYGISTELTYELTRDETDHLTFTGTNKTATSVDDMTFGTSDGTSTIITYHAHVEFNGVARLADPLAQIGFGRLADTVERQMTAALAGR